MRPDTDGGFFLSELIEVIGPNGRPLTPCAPDVAARQVRLHRAHWVGKRRIRLRFDPFAYRYIRLKVLERDKYICYWCSSPGFTIDHIIPWSKGGRTNLANCICACEKCNGARGDKPAEEFAAELDVPPPAAGSAFEAPVLPMPMPKPALSMPSRGALTLLPRVATAAAVEVSEPFSPPLADLPEEAELLTTGRARLLAKLLDRDLFTPPRHHLR